MAQRNQYVDFVKFILIGGVIWGHSITAMTCNETITPIFIHQFFRTFDMPCFMLLSGYFFRISIERYSVTALLLDKLTMLLFPIMLWNLILYKNMFGWGTYFLMAVYLSTVLVTCVHALCAKVKYLELLVFALVCAALNCTDNHLYNMSYLFPFFLLGYYRLLWNTRVSAFIVVPCFVASLCFWKGDYTIWNTGDNILNRWQTLLPVFSFRFAIGCIGILAVNWILSLLYYRAKNHKWMSFVLLSGQYTMALYILHPFVLRVFSKILKYVIANLFDGVNPLLFNYSFMGYVIAPVLTLAIIIVLTYFIDVIMKNEKLKFVFGFKLKSVKR